MLLEMKDVVKQFGGLTAVSNMSFHVDEGEIYGVIGPNGAGKTTIFNLITGVYQVTEGDVIFNGQSIEGKKLTRSSTWALPVHSRTSAFSPV
mgnify:CR=1 FL=1